MALQEIIHHDRLSDSLSSSSLAKFDLAMYGPTVNEPVSIFDSVIFLSSERKKIVG